ncbi:MAG: pilus assembly protein N-terminal domain-containing protein [Alphaproteobacteria bacterium]|nr:pilus assembly protein N-terminal domain-containing protein [Alphaproteobacteria bacterium]
MPFLSLTGNDIPDSIDPDYETELPIRLTPDKSEIIRLPRPGAAIVLGNPNHLSILADNAQTLILVPKAPGATYFAVLDDKSNIIMQRHVIVASPKEKYVRIRRSCADGTEGCKPMQVYYCPDMCHEISLEEQEQKSDDMKSLGTATAATANAAGAASGGEEGNSGSSEGGQ